MSFDRSIKLQYFGFAPAAGHAVRCGRYGTDLWEVARSRRGSGARDEVTIRLLCRECGVVTFETFPSSLSVEGTSTSETGYGAQPVQVAGLWLHAGPRMLERDPQGPAAYFLTRSRAVPCTFGEVVGSVAWHVTRRGAVRWSAGYGLTPTGYIARAAEEEFKSRRAAAAWVAAQAGGTP